MAKELAKALAERGLPSDNDRVSLRDERGAAGEDDDDSEPLDLVCDVGAMGKVIKRTPRATHYLLETNQLQGCAKVGGRWCGSPRRLRRQFAALLGAE